MLGFKLSHVSITGAEDYPHSRANNATRAVRGWLPDALGSSHEYGVHRCGKYPRHNHFCHNTVSVWRQGPASSFHHLPTEEVNLGNQCDLLRDKSKLNVHIAPTYFAGFKEGRLFRVKLRICVTKRIIFSLWYNRDHLIAHIYIFVLYISKLNSTSTSFFTIEFP